MRTLLSNQIEELASLLRNNLKGKRVLIAVQDNAMKSYLQMQVLPFGVEILTLQHAVERILFISHIANDKRHHASSLDLYVGAMALHPTGSIALIEEIVKEAKDWGLFGQHRYEMAIKTPARLKIAEIRDALCRHPAQRFPFFEGDVKQFSYYDEVHLFGISALPAFYHDFFLTLSQHVALSLYVVSPCMMFWSDICTDKEAKKLEQRFDADLLYDRSPLLANCGMLGRDFGALLDEIEEAYVVPDNVEGFRPDAVVKRVSEQMSSLQTHLLLLNSEVSSDGRVVLHKAPTLLREVEALYESLSTRLQLETADCIIYAPDIERYRPYIERVFGQRHSLPFQIYGQTPYRSHGVIATFFSFLKLSAQDWSADLLLELFQCPSLQNKYGLKSDDHALFANCMQHFGLRWGMLKEDAYEGSFEAFQARILESVTSTSTLSLSDAEVIIQCVSIIEQLYQELEPIKNSCQAVFLESLLENHFAKGDDEYDRLLRAILRLKKSAHTMSNPSFSFSMISYLLQKSLEEEESHDIIPWAPFIFTSFGNFRNYPAKFVALLGMNEAALTVPYHFIEAIVSFREKLFISYQTAVNPASCITDLQKVILDLQPMEHMLDRSILSFEKPAFTASFFTERADEKTVAGAIAPNELLQTVSAPLRTYFQKEMLLHLFEKKEERFDDDFKEIAAYNFSRLKKEAFFMPQSEEQQLYFEKVFAHLPPALSKACRTLLAEKIAHFPSREPLIIELNPACKAPKQVANNHWYLPAISLTNQDVAISGTLSEQVVSGIPVFTKKSIESMAKTLPQLAILAYLKEKYMLPVELNLLFIEEESSLAIPIENPEALVSEFVAYHLHCQKEACCIYPSWLPKLLEEQTAPDDFFATVLDDRVDNYLQFYLSRIDKEAFSMKWPLWHARSKHLFGVLHGL